MLRYPLLPNPVTVLGKNMTGLLVRVVPRRIAVDKRSEVNVLIVAGRFERPILLRDTLGLTNETEPFVKDVRTNPVENGELLEISYAKILRKAIESVSYVFLELALIYFVE